LRLRSSSIPPSDGIFVASARDSIGGLELFQCSERGPDDVDGVIASQRLRQDVLDPSSLDDSTDTASGDDTGAGRSWLQQNPRRAEGRLDCMWNRRSIKRHSDQRLLGSFDPLPDRIRNLVSFPETGADSAFAVAYNNK